MKIIHVFLNNLVILKAGVAAEFFQRGSPRMTSNEHVFIFYEGVKAEIAWRSHDKIVWDTKWRYSRIN